MRVLERQTNPDQVFWMIQQIGFPGFILTESAAQKEALVPEHSHEQPHITAVLEGNCFENYRGRTRELAPLTVIYTYPGEPHTIRLTSKRFRTFDIELKSDWLEGRLERPISPTVLMEYRNHTISWLISRLYQEFREMDDLSPIAMEGLALEILADLARAARCVKTKKAPHWLRLVMEQIQEEFSRTITLSELAKTAGVNPSHLAEVFREHFQCTPAEFIRELRIEHSIRQMANSDLSLSEISLTAGFSDQSHFSRIFKRATGLTPAKYRRLHFDPLFVQNTR